MQLNSTVAKSDNISTHNMLIGGEWVPALSGKTLEIENPADGSIIAHVPDADEKDVDRAVRAAENGFKEWGRMTGVERATVLTRAAEILRDRLDDFIDVEV